jgi:hypothetical protein
MFLQYYENILLHLQNNLIKIPVLTAFAVC